MKLLSIIIMLAALYLLYRIAFPKQADTAKGGNTPEKEKKTFPNVMGKSRYVLSGRSQPVQASAISLGSDSKEDKPSTFASETEEKRPAVIPSEQLDEVFGDEPNIEIMSLSLEDENEDEIDPEEEAEEIRQALGHEAILADGTDYDDLQTAVKVAREQPGEVSEETGRTFTALENTDMFEMLVSGDEGKRNWIKAIIDRNIQYRMPETESETSEMNYDNFDITDIL